MGYKKSTETVDHPFCHHFTIILISFTHTLDGIRTRVYHPQDLKNFLGLRSGRVGRLLPRWARGWCLGFARSGHHQCLGGEPGPTSSRAAVDHWWALGFMKFKWCWPVLFFLSGNVQKKWKSQILQKYIKIQELVMYFAFDRFGGYYGVLFGFMTCGKPVSPTINHHDKHLLGMVCDWVNLCLPHIFDLDWWFLLFTWFLKNETCGLILQKAASCWRHGQKHGVWSRKGAHPNIVKMPIGESLLKFIEISMISEVDTKHVFTKKRAALLMNDCFWDWWFQQPIPWEAGGHVTPISLYSLHIILLTYYNYSTFWGLYTHVYRIYI